MQAFWDVQRKVPAVQMYGNIIICPNEFLHKKLDSIVKVVDKKSADYKGVVRDYLSRLDASISQYVQLMPPCG